ncbi:MAG: sigma-70 family RNA polymerase sigma factor [Bacteroidetes bacterium]|nr:sigma-70 family RNA polymerase sigma factor [Bacteroidota bacterium]
MKPIETSSSQVDSQLWSQLKNGSEWALGRLVKKYFNPLQNYGCKFVQSEDFVKDCVQEVFIEVWQRRERLSTPVSVRAYLLSSVRKKVLREGFRQRILKDEQHEIDTVLDWHSQELPHEWAIIEQENVELLTQKITILLDKLPKRQREVIYLQFYQNLNRDEIAQIMEVNPQSVSNLVQSALKVFRIHWQVIQVLLGLVMFN